MFKLLLGLFGGKQKYQHLFETIGNLAANVRYVGYSDDGKRYEHESIVLERMFKEAGSDGLTIMDVGANIGEYAANIVQLAAKYNKPYKLFAFEPAAKTYAHLAKRFADNDNIICINKALSNEDGTAELYSDSEKSDLASVHNLKNAYRDFDDKYIQKITLTTLDGVMKEYGLTKVDYLKIDAEGHDFYVLKGATAALAQKAIRAIQFEFGPPNIDSRVFFRDFWDTLHVQYNMYRIIKNGIYPIMRYTPQLEVFLITNFVAILK